MSKNLTAKFETRREAEMAIERLVQQFGIERTSIFVTSETDTNTAGVRVAGADAKAGEPSVEERRDADLEGRVELSVDIDDEERIDALRSTFAEFKAGDVTER